MASVTLAASSTSVTGTGSRRQATNEVMLALERMRKAAPTRREYFLRSEFSAHESLINLTFHIAIFEWVPP